MLTSFPPEDLAKDTSEMEFSLENPHMQISLGMCWKMGTDTFTFQVCSSEKPYTKRGILSTFNCVFDPLRFVSPVILGGRLLLRAAIDTNPGWDEPLPDPLKSN